MNEAFKLNDFPTIYDEPSLLVPQQIAALDRQIRGAPQELVAAGKKLHEEGVPSANIQPCSSCHGPEAKGIGAAPRLAGQLHEYTSKTLMNWSNERGRDPTTLQPRARSLPRAKT